MRLLLVVLAAAWIVPAAWGADSPDCVNFDKGETILTNITTRYYQRYEQPPASPEDNLGLQGSVLYWMKADASAAYHIAEARFKGGGGACAPMATAVANLSAAYQAEVSLIDAAWGKCTGADPDEDHAGDCYQSVKPVFAKEKEIQKRGGALDAFLRAFEAHPECETLSTDEVALYNRLLKQPCERDARCAVKRIGKMREARAALGKVKGAGTAFTKPVSELLIADTMQDCTDGKAAPPEASGAEHILWCLDNSPQYDTRLLFVATQKVATSSAILRRGSPSVCGGN